MNEKAQQFINEFTSVISALIDPKESLTIGLPRSNINSRDLPCLFSEVKSTKKVTFEDTSLITEEFFDLVLGTIPMGLRPTAQQKSDMISQHLNWDLIFQFSKVLSKNGFGIFLIEPKGFGLKNQGVEFLHLMAKEDIYVKGYINTPRDILQPATSLQPVFVVTSRRKAEFKLLDLSSSNNVEQDLKGFFDESNHCVPTGDFPVSSFQGFRHYEVGKQLQSLETRYKEYKSISLESVAIKINRGKKDTEFEDLPNSIFFKFLGSNRNLHTSATDLTGRIDNYLQIQLSDELDNQYLNIFFQSSLGELILEYAMNSQFIPRLDRDLLISMDIPVPPLAVQKQVVETHRRLHVLQDEINLMKDQISINPQSIATSSKIDKMLDIANSLSEGDKIKSFILMGESKTLEFKQTFQHCLNTNLKKDYVEVSVLKTVVGFLNSEGGTLLVGVEDNGLIPGIENERKIYHKDSNDNFVLHVKDKIKKRIGMHFFQFITIKIIEVDDVSVLEVGCSPSDEEVFLDDKDFYIRTPASTDKIEGKNLSKYLMRRFNSD